MNEERILERKSQLALKFAVPCCSIKVLYIFIHIFLNTNSKHMHDDFPKSWGNLWCLLYSTGHLKLLSSWLLEPHSKGPIKCVPKAPVMSSAVLLLPAEPQEVKHQYGFLRLSLWGVFCRSYVSLSLSLTLCFVGFFFFIALVLSSGSWGFYELSDCVLTWSALTNNRE